MIEAVGLKDEHDSPFLIENKRICEFWDNLITKKGGNAHGRYTAWALLLNGNFKSNNEWKIKLEKSTSFSDGNLAISDDDLIYKQTLLIASEVDFPSSNFLIRKSTWLDKLRNLYNSNKFKLNSKSRYILLGTPMNESIRSLIENLHKPIQDEKLVLLEYSSKTKQLTIEIRTLLTDRGQINKILNFG